MYPRRLYSSLNSLLKSGTLLWYVTILTALLILLGLIQVGYTYQWTGFGQSKVNGVVQPSKSLWDWLDLLIVPAVLALGGYLFNRAERQRTQYDADLQRAQERKLADERRQADMLQAYYEQIGKLLSERDLRNTDREEIRVLARGLTLTVLQEVDGNGKGSLLTFLHGAGLISTENPAVALTGADLQGVALPSTSTIENLSQGAVLRGAILNGANLQEANLYRAFLPQANLQEANLQEANLQEARVQRTNLYGANLGGANLFRANLGEANLQYAYLQDAYLREANLGGANLQRANLQGVTGISDEELTERGVLIVPIILTEATMPNGQKYEDWLKDREKRQQDE